MKQQLDTFNLWYNSQSSRDRKLIVAMAKNIPIDADARTAQLDNAFGMLLLLSLVLERLV